MGVTKKHYKVEHFIYASLLFNFFYAKSTFLCSKFIYLILKCFIFILIKKIFFQKYSLASNKQGGMTRALLLLF